MKVLFLILAMVVASNATYTKEEIIKVLDSDGIKGLIEEIGQELGKLKNSQHNKLTDDDPDTQKERTILDELDKKAQEVARNIKSIKARATETYGQIVPASVSKKLRQVESKIGSQKTLIKIEQRKLNNKLVKSRRNKSNQKQKG